MDSRLLLETQASSLSKFGARGKLRADGDSASRRKSLPQWTLDLLAAPDLFYSPPHQISLIGLSLLVTDCYRQFYDKFGGIMADLEPWLSVEEIARPLSLSKETVYRWLEREKIPAHRMGKLWGFKPSEVDE